MHIDCNLWLSHVESMWQECRCPNLRYRRYTRMRKYRNRPGYRHYNPSRYTVYT
jgi:hypothetical protein